MSTQARIRGLILFDIDGTLLQAGDPDHQAAFVAAMQEIYDRPATLAGVPLAGMLDSQIARLALARHGLAEEEINARLSAMIARMGERYAEAVARESRIERLLPGVVEVATRLRDEGFALGVLTGNAEVVARVKLAATGIDELFPIGAYGDAAEERSELVEAGLRAAHRHYGTTFGTRRTVLVGDTPRDIAAARDADTWVAAVATGRFTAADLAAYEPDVLLPDLSDVEAAVAAIAGLVHRPVR